MSKIHVGMSGWTFPGWRNGFYPKGLAQKKELAYASRQVNSIEINGTFYSFQKPESFQKWFDETPDDFCFSVKAPRYITHIKRLNEVEQATSDFFASGLLCLKEKLGPILWQFPPNVTLKDDRFERFLKIIPYDAEAASNIAKKHSPKRAEKSYTAVDRKFAVRHAFEFRHPSFKNSDFIDVLRGHGVAVVFAHTGTPYLEDVTADFIYARMHGEGKSYKKGYPESAIKAWADRVSTWTSGKQPPDADCASPTAPKVISRDAYIYFDTAEKEFAPSDAKNLSRILGITKSLK